MRHAEETLAALYLSWLKHQHPQLAVAAMHGGRWHDAWARIAASTDQGIICLALSEGADHMEGQTAPRRNLNLQAVACASQCKLLTAHTQQAHVLCAEAVAAKVPQLLVEAMRNAVECPKLAALGYCATSVETIHYCVPDALHFLCNDGRKCTERDLRPELLRLNEVAIRQRGERKRDFEQRAAQLSYRQVVAQASRAAAIDAGALEVLLDNLRTEAWTLMPLHHAITLRECKACPVRIQHCRMVILSLLSVITEGDLGKLKVRHLRAVVQILKFDSTAIEKADLVRELMSYIEETRGRDLALSSWYSGYGQPADPPTNASSSTKKRMGGDSLPSPPNEVIRKRMKKELAKLA